MRSVAAVGVRRGRVAVNNRHREKTDAAPALACVAAMSGDTRRGWYGQAQRTRHRGRSQLIEVALPLGAKWLVGA